MNPFAFEPLGSPLAGISAPAKGVFLLCVSIAAMKYGLVALSLLAAASLIIQRAADIPFRGMGKTALFIAYLSLFSAIVRGIFPGDGRVFAAETLPGSALYSLRLATVFVYARLFYVSTKASSLGEFLTSASRNVFRLLGSEKRRKAAGKGEAAAGGASAGEGILSDPGMLLSLSLLFLPRVFDNYAKVREAAALRGYGRGRKKIAHFLPMMQTFIFMSIKGALLTAGAMELRSYSSERTIEREKFTGADCIVAAAGISLILLPCLPGVA